MSEEPLSDDQSHYEVSLTAGQAFLAFVLLLLSLAACFAFGLMIGRGQADERLVVRTQPPVINEAGVMPKKQGGRIQELGVADDDFGASAAAAPATIDSTAPTITEEPASTDSASPVPVNEPPVGTTPVVTSPAQAAVPAAKPAESHPATTAADVPFYAQLLSIGDQKTAEGLAARLINGGFNSAYVERSATEKGPVFRVRVRFASESAARGAEAKLREFSKDVWIVKAGL